MAPSDPTGSSRAFIVCVSAAIILPAFGGDRADIALAAALIAWFAVRVRERIPGIPTDVFALAFFGLSLWLCMGPLWSVSPRVSIAKIQLFPLYLAAFFVGAEIVRRERNLRWVLGAVLVLYAYCVLDGIVQKFTGVSLRGRELDHGRVRLQFTHPNDLTLLAVWSPIAMVLLSAARRRVQVVGAMLLAGVMMLVIWSGSRSGLLGLLAGWGLVAAVMLPWKRLILAAICCGAVLGSSYAFDVGGLRERILMAFGPPYDPRLAVWAVDLAMWREFPILGRGPGTYSLAYLSHLESLALPETWEIYPGVIEHPHGIFMSALVEYGTIGLLLLLGVFVLGALAIVRAQRDEPSVAYRNLCVGLAAAWVTLAVCGVVEFWLGRRWVLTMFAMLAGMIAGLSRRSER